MATAADGLHEVRGTHAQLEPDLGDLLGRDRRARVRCRQFKVDAMSRITGLDKAEDGRTGPHPDRFGGK